MHLAPLAGIETDLRSSSSLHDQMHLAPLAGIETTRSVQLLRMELRMHLAPLAGIETSCGSWLFASTGS